MTPSLQVIMTGAWIYAPLLILGTIGVGGVLLGFLGLLMHSSRLGPSRAQRSAAIGALTAVISVSAFGLVASQPSAVWLPPLILAGSFVLLWLFLTHPAIDKITRLMRLELFRAAFWGLFIVGCLGVGVQQGLSQDEELDGTALLQTHYETRPPSLKKAKETAATDRGRTIYLLKTVDSPDTWSESEILERQTKLLDSFGLREQIIALGVPIRDCNCFGLVFTGGKYWIDRTAVEQIMEDNGYRAVRRPVNGDLVAYRSGNGTVEHVGIVRFAEDKGRIMVESKWGLWGRFLHPHDVHLWSGCAYTFYRNNRKAGHMVRGLD